jgi:hypothetical protein
MAVPFAAGIFAIGLDQFLAARRKSPNAPNPFSLFMKTQSNFFELATAGFFSLLVGLIIWAWLTTPDTNAMLKSKTFWQGIACGALAIVGFIIAKTTDWWNTRRALICALFFMAGVSVYIYMPLAAATNPPMNWGYAATKEGFVHAVTRGQYQKIEVASFFSYDFLLKIKLFIQAMINQYSFPASVFSHFPAGLRPLLETINRLTLPLLGLVSPIAILLMWTRIKPRAGPGNQYQVLCARPWVLRHADRLRNCRLVQPFCVETKGHWPHCGPPGLHRAPRDAPYNLETELGAVQSARL